MLGTIGGLSNILLRIPTYRHASVSQPIHRNLHPSILCGHWMLFRGLAKNDDWQGHMARVKGNLYCQHAFMMMMNNGHSLLICKGTAKKVCQIVHHDKMHIPS